MNSAYGLMHGKGDPFLIAKPWMFNERAACCVEFQCQVSQVQLSVKLCHANPRLFEHETVNKQSHDEFEIASTHTVATCLGVCLFGCQASFAIALAFSLGNIFST